MTVEELVWFCAKNNIPLNTQIALRAKDDYFLIEEGVQLGQPYFGNSREGEEWMDENAPRDKQGDIDYDNLPQFLILDTYSG